jgi:hypothetical protein
MAQKKPAGKPIKITLTESQISDIIQRAAKTRRSIRVESLEDRIAPSRIGLPIFGGAEDADKFDDSTPPADDLPGVQHGDGPLFSDGAPTTDGDGSFLAPQDPYSDGGGNDGIVDPTDPLNPDNPGDGLLDPTAGPGDGVLDPTNPDLSGGDINPPGGPDEIVNPLVEPGTEGGVNPTVDEAANVEFNENLHLQGDAPDAGLSSEEMEEHRLNILRQLRGQ